MPDDCTTIALGLPELRVIREVRTDREITVEVEFWRRWACCLRCGYQTLKLHGPYPKWKRARRLWDKPVFLVLHRPRQKSEVLHD